MKNKSLIVLFSYLVLLVFQLSLIPAEHSGYARAADSKLSLDQILDGVEKKYANTQFSAEFFQESTIKAMDITDLASGKVFIRHPGRMRWEYDEPDKQIIITDAQKLWIYRPEDNQVMTGSAPAFFRDGKGASFLSDINLIRRKFSISLQGSDEDLFYELKLVPQEKTLDVSEILVSVSKNTFSIVRVVTYNSYGDETRIEFVNLKFNAKLEDSLFSFEIPKGVDVLELDE